MLMWTHIHHTLQATAHMHVMLAYLIGRIIMFQCDHVMFWVLK